MSDSLAGDLVVAEPADDGPVFPVTTDDSIVIPSPSADVPVIPDLPSNGPVFTENFQLSLPKQIVKILVMF